MYIYKKKKRNLFRQCEDVLSYIEYLELPEEVRTRLHHKSIFPEILTSIFNLRDLLFSIKITLFYVPPTSSSSFSFLLFFLPPAFGKKKILKERGDASRHSTPPFTKASTSPKVPRMGGARQNSGASPCAFSNTLTTLIGILDPNQN